MAPEEEEDERDKSSSEDDDAFDEDMEALKRACMITGTDPHDLRNPSSPPAAPTAGESISQEDDDDDDDEDDLELVRNIRNRFSTFSNVLEPLSLKPLCVLPPATSDDDDDNDEDDDFETLRAIQKRFEAYDYDALKNSTETSLETQEQVPDPRVSLEKGSCTDLVVHRNDACSPSGSEYACGTTSQLGGHLEMQPSAEITWHHRNNSNPSTSQSNYSSFPKSARVFMDAIKKNRYFQKILRSKLILIETKIEENKKLKERFKILRDFQINCKRRTGRALSQLKDSRVQLISRKKPWPCKDSKVHDKRFPATYYGPEENSHVANYKMALTKFPLSLERKKWSENEIQNLEKGIQQQFQEKMVQVMVDRLSGGPGEYHDVSDDLDNILASIKNLDITPENIKAFLPKVNWEQLAFMHVAGRSGAECEARWLNFEDPLINRNPWTAEEDKYLLLFVQEKGISNWIDIAASLRTNRTPFQCLARYQRSLNVSILKREWTKDEDAKLRSAVEIFGESDWQSVASVLEGWTGTQCSNRWKKSLHPTREKIGRWTAEEDKRLKVAQLMFGPRNWKKTSQFVPGRTEVQCRERWVNSLDPSLNWDKWTIEEDAKLRAAIAEHGYCWAKVAAAMPRRTDNMCRRRWKKLLPDEVPLLQAARRIQKAAFIGNFVDRESERPALCPSDFGPLQLMTTSENINQSKKQAGKLRETKKRNLKKSRENSQTDQKEVLGISNLGNYGESEPETKKRKQPYKLRCKKTDHTEPNNNLLEPEKLNLTGDGGWTEPHEAMSRQGSEESKPETKKRKRPFKPRSKKTDRTEPNGDWTEPVGQADRFDAHEAITSKSSRKSKSETKKRKRPYKPRSKKTDLIDPNEERESLLLQPENLNLTGDGDWIEPVDQADRFDAHEAITRKKSQESRSETKKRKRPYKPRSKKTDVIDPTEERESLLLQPEKLNLTGDGDWIEPVDQAGRFDAHEAITMQGPQEKKPETKKRKRPYKPRSKKTDLTEPNKGRECLLLQPEKLNLTSNGDWTTPLGQADGVDVHEAITRQGSQKKSKPDAKKRKRSSKARSKMAELAEPNEEREEGLLLQPERWNLRSDGDWTEPLGQCNTTSTKTKRGSAPQNTEMSPPHLGEHQHSSLSSDNSLLTGITTDVTVQQPGRSPCLDSTEITAVSGKKIDTPGENDKIASEKKKVTKQYRRRTKEVVSVPSQQRGPNVVTANIDIPPTGIVCSDQNGVSADFDIPLISFLKNKSKKRKLKVNGCGSNQPCPPLIIQQEADTANAGSVKPTSNGELTTCDYRASDKFPLCNVTSGLAADNEAGRPYLDMEMESIDMESGNDVSNIPVVSLVQEKPEMEK